MKTTLTLVAFLLTASVILSQKDYEAEYMDRYNKNIQLEYINEVYIPSDVMDALAQIDALSNEAGRKRLLEAPEDLAAERLVLGLGKWMIVNWNFYEGSRLSHHLKTYGVTFPEDMAKFLIVSYHRHLRGVPLDLEQRGQTFYDLRKKEQDIRNSKKKVIKEIIKSKL